MHQAQGLSQGLHCDTFTPFGLPEGRREECCKEAYVPLPDIDGSFPDGLGKERQKYVQMRTTIRAAYAERDCK